MELPTELFSEDRCCSSQDRGKVEYGEIYLAKIDMPMEGSVL